MGLTPDGLPLVGQLPEMGQVHFAVGFGGRGLAWAFVVAERLTKLVLYDTTWETMELLKVNPSATVSEE